MRKRVSNKEVCNIIPAITSWPRNAKKLIEEKLLAPIAIQEKRISKIP